VRPSCSAVQARDLSASQWSRAGALRSQCIRSWGELLLDDVRTLADEDRTFSWIAGRLTCWPALTNSLLVHRGAELLV
jgi:hypothetical protein